MVCDIHNFASVVFSIYYTLMYIHSFTVRIRALYACMPPLYTLNAYTCPLNAYVRVRSSSLKLWGQMSSYTHTRVHWMHTYAWAALRSSCGGKCPHIRIHASTECMLTPEQLFAQAVGANVFLLNKTQEWARVCMYVCMHVCMHIIHSNMCLYDRNIITRTYMNAVCSFCTIHKCKTC
jgi:hypothetical protein